MPGNEGENKEHVNLIISAPGKVILHGEHAVVHGKRALACSVDLRTYLHVREDGAGLVLMHLPDIDLHREWKVEDIAMRLPKNNNLCSGDGVKSAKEPSAEELAAICEFCGFQPDTHDTKELAAVAFLYLYSTILHPDQMVGHDFMVSSNLPTSAGLGSSAAFAVTLVSSLLTLSGAIRRPSGEESFNVWPANDLRLINSWAFVAEKIIHGNPSGVDNSVSTFGGIVKYQNKEVTTLECKHELSVMVTNTKVPRSTKKLVSGVGAKLRALPDIINPVLDAIEAISVRCQNEITSAEPMNEELVKELISANQSLLCVLGVNHPALEHICRVTADSNLPSKLTGAGGGGCAFTLIPSGTSQLLISSVMSTLVAAGYDCWKTVIGGPGVGLHLKQPNGDFTIPEALHDRARTCSIL